MHRRVIAYIALLLITFTVVGCNVTRNLPEGQYLVSKVKFQEDETTPRDERITVDKDGIDVYVRLCLGV